MKTTVQKLLILISIGILASCSSSNKYSKLQTAEDAVKNDELKSGLLITKSGAVLDIKVEEVRAQKDRLEMENEKLQSELDYEKNRATNLEMKYRELRIVAGLPPKEAEKTYKIGPAGNIAEVSGRDFNDEIQDLRQQRGPANLSELKEKEQTKEANHAKKEDKKESRKSSDKKEKKVVKKG